MRQRCNCYSVMKTGHEAVVRLLLERDDVDADEALSFAAYGGHETILQVLRKQDGVNSQSAKIYREQMVHIGNCLFREIARLTGTERETLDQSTDTIVIAVPESTRRRKFKTGSRSFTHEHP